MQNKKLLAANQEYRHSVHNISNYFGKIEQIIKEKKIIKLGTIKNR